MKNANDRGQELPEFTPEYIDQLFSSTFPKPKPERTPEAVPPAEQKEPVFTAAKAAAMQETETEEYEPEPKKVWRKPLLILAAAVVTVVLCMNILNAIANAKANANSDQWQARCEETYVELISRKAYHYTRQITIGANTKNAEIWHHGSKQLSISDWASPGQKYIELFVNQIRYTKLIEADGSSFKWKHKADTSWIVDTTPKTLAEGKYILESIRGSLSGTEVTFKKDLRGSADRLIFHFDAGGNFTALSETGRLEMENYTRLYTFLPTSDEEILATILKYHEDATQ